ARQTFDESLDDDLNTAQALAAVFEYVRETNTLMDSGEFPGAAAAGALQPLDPFDAVFDVLQPRAPARPPSNGEIQARIPQRPQAKKAKDFAGADRVRQELLDQGVILEDTKDGVRWKRK